MNPFLPLDVKNKICDFLKVKDITNYSCVDTEIKYDDHAYKRAYKTMRKYMHNAKHNKLLRFKTYKEVIEYLVHSSMPSTRRNLGLRGLPAYNIGTYLEDFSFENSILPSQLVKLEHRQISSRLTHKYVVECSRHGDILKHFIVSGKNIRHIKLRYANFYPEANTCIVWASSYNNASLIHLQPFLSGLIVIATFFNFYLDIDADEINFVKAKFLYVDTPERRVLANIKDTKPFVSYYSPEKIKNYLPSDHPDANIICHRHIWQYGTYNYILSSIPEGDVTF